MPRPLPPDFHARLLATASDGDRTIRQLAADLGVAPVTVRRHLDQLRAAGHDRPTGGVHLTRAAGARRIDAWYGWQARRRHLGLPAAGKPYFGLDRILSRNERRAV